MAAVLMAVIQDRLTLHDNVLVTGGARVELTGSFGTGLSPRAAIQRGRPAPVKTAQR
jgi:hypothetical protein